MPDVGSLGNLDGLCRLATPGAAAEDERAFTEALARLLETAPTLGESSLALEALPSEDLKTSLGKAHRTGLLQPLLDPRRASAPVALYQLVRTLPPSAERTLLEAGLNDAINRGAGRSLVRLLAAMVVRERRMPELRGLEARVSLCFDHDALDPGAQELSLALFAATELHERWLSGAAAGPLPQRMLSAQLLASAAYGATQRALESDEAALSLMSSPTQHALRQRLLFDREPLVWRVAALARGWLSAFSPHEAAGIEVDLSPKLSPTEWRRAGLSLVAKGALRPSGVLARIDQMRTQKLFEKDWGLAAVMLHGLWGAPDNQAMRGVGKRLLELSGKSAAPELTVLLLRSPESSLLRHLTGQMIEQLDAPAEHRARWDALKHDAMYRALLLAMGDPGNAGSLAHRVRRGVQRFWDDGPDSAFAEASVLLRDADAMLGSLQTAADGRLEHLWKAFDAVRDLQQGVLSAGALSQMLALGQDTERANSGLNYFRERLTNLLMLDLSVPLEGPGLELQRERAVAVIRVLDMDIAEGEGFLDEGARVRALQVLLSKLREPANAPLRRPLCAAVARAADGLVQVGDWETADVLMLASVGVPDAECCQIMAEASMVPEVVDALGALHTCLTQTQPNRAELRQGIDRIVQTLPAIAGPRMTALRSALTGLAECLDGAAQDGQTGRGAAAFTTLEQLALGLSVKLTGESHRGADWQGLFEQDDAEMLAARIEESFLGPLGPWLAQLAPELKLAALDDSPRFTERYHERLPHWLPATRELGDYIVLRAVGGGACGSVFLTRRRGQQLRRGAPTYALKVPELGDGTTRLSRDRFLEMFCAEAGALASLPSHPNLAALESFDRSAMPMPFLVMEHVQGPSLDSVLLAGGMSFERAVDALIGVARGLLAMHAHGIGHLDLKPSNVILRPSGEGAEDAVLVDFGLAGRHVRADCGTHAYAAPEVFGTEAEQADPCRADVYSFAVLAFEVLTGGPLFPGPSEIAYIAQHLSHDGNPPALKALGQSPESARLLPLMAAMLRQDPETRCTIGTALDVLSALRKPVNSPPLPRLPAQEKAVDGRY